jgi:formylglycine-generating enzyme required for sulfatase activity
MILVDGGTFMMGCTPEQGYDPDRIAYPVHQVKVSSFYISKYLITQQQWTDLVGRNPSIFKGPDLPVENLSWDHAQQFISCLNRVTGKKYRLPTEAEWEYAARGGKFSKGYKFSGSNNIDDVAWHHDNSDKKTHPVGTKQPNELGIYDMSGNVFEWCQDLFDCYYYERSEKVDPTGPSGFGAKHCVRGGSWFHDETERCRVSCRMSSVCHTCRDDLGFRLVLPLP